MGTLSRKMTSKKRFLSLLSFTLSPRLDCKGGIINSIKGTSTKMSVGVIKGQTPPFITPNLQNNGTI